MSHLHKLMLLKCLVNNGKNGKILAIAMNEGSMTPCHHFQICVVLNPASLLNRELCVKV